MKSVTTANVPGYKTPGYRSGGYGGFGMRRGTSARAKNKARKCHADGGEPSQKARRKRAKRKAIAVITKELDRDRLYPYIKVSDASYHGNPAIWLRREIDLVFSNGRLVHPRTIFLSSENTRFISSSYFKSSENVPYPKFLAGNNAAPDVCLLKPERQSRSRGLWDY